MLNLANCHNSSDRSTKSTLSGINALQLLVNAGFQVLFHSPSGVLFTFPSQYYFTIGHRLVFRLGGWSPRLPTRFLVPRGTLDAARLFGMSCTGLLPSTVSAFQPLIPLYRRITCCSPQPQQTEVCWFGLFRFRSPLLTESLI